jgi:hypothetical protein
MEMFTSFRQHKWNVKHAMNSRGTILRFSLSHFSLSRAVLKSKRNVLFYIKQKSGAGDKFSFTLEFIITLFATRWDSSRRMFTQAAFH